MSTDLSHLLPGGPVSCLIPTGQATADQRGNQAHTAPGSVPAAPHADNPAPSVDAIEHTETTLKDGHDAGLDGGKPMLRMGQWNDFGGGAEPRGYRR